jgi:hypothetical protein
MKYSPEDIKSNPRFVLLDELNYDEIVNFTAKYIRKGNSSMVLFYIFLAGTFLLVIGSLVFGMVYHNREFGGIMKQYLYGLILSFSAMIPIHEIIHGIIYVLLGARKVYFGAEFKQFAFYAVADEFVTGKNGFYMLAVGPFLTVSVLCLLGFILVPGIASYTYISILFFHTTMCIGDFALMSYYDSNKDKNIFTFDDIRNRISYYYYLKE